MLEFVCYSLVWIFAIYGFIEVLKVIAYTFIKTPIKQNGELHIIIGVKNCENNIESFIRTFFSKILNYNNVGCQKVIVVDMNSTDNSRCILKKLNEDYSFEYKELQSKESEKL